MKRIFSSIRLFLASLAFGYMMPASLALCETVYDKNNIPIGTNYDIYTIRKIGSDNIILNASISGFYNSASPFGNYPIKFTSNNCTGTKYLLQMGMRGDSFFVSSDNKSLGKGIIFYAGAPYSVINVRSQLWGYLVSNSGVILGGTCSDISFGPTAVGIMKSWSVNFTPPFSLR